MTEATGYLKLLLNNLRRLREEAGLTSSELEERLILGPGWITRFEQGETIPSVNMLLAILHQTGNNLGELLDKLPDSPKVTEIDRFIYAEQSGKDIVIHFQYADFDAEYTLANSTVDQFEVVVKTMRDGLARLASTDATLSEAIKTDAVAKTFLKAVEVWPHGNPSDIWWFIVYRAYCDPYNHPAQYARLDFSQSWKRTGGWALEQVLIQHYGPFLKKNKIKLFIADNATKSGLITQFKVRERLEADKIDVLLTSETPKGEKLFGVVHVKASFAERRTDDVPMSRALVKAGYTSPLWTMDCKSTPREKPINRGELGDSSGERSAKRKDIEDEGYFSGCFSYNRNTEPSPKSLPVERRIYVCNFNNPNDVFSKFIISRCRKYLSA